MPEKLSKEAIKSLRDEYAALSAGTYSPAVEARMDEIQKLIKTKPFTVRRMRIAYRGSYEDTLASRWREYKLEPSDPLYRAPATNK